MKQEASFEGFIYQNKATVRKPVYLIQDKKGYPVVTLEKLLAKNLKIPSIISAWEARWNKNHGADFVLDGSSYTQNKKEVMKLVKRVKVTVIVEEI